ncbi:MAG TPA: hypothetical protein VGK73_34930 [Polyangiaceae bacterium]
MSGWLAGEHRIDLERVATDVRFWPHFLRCLVILELRGVGELPTVESVTAAVELARAAKRGEPPTPAEEPAPDSGPSAPTEDTPKTGTHGARS